MIYPAEADIVPFLKSLTQSLQPYAQANDVHLSFSSSIKKQVISYQPLLLSQSLIQLVCNMVNMLPPKSKIQVRLLNRADNQNLQVEVENTTINLIRVNEVCAQTLYSFAVQPLANGTLYLLSLAWNHKASTGNELVQTNTSGNNLPPFYVEIQRRLRAHFTQADKLIAALAQNQPHEAAFMQK